MSTFAALSVALAATLAVVGILAHFRDWRWTGFANKTLWDWLHLLIIPLVLASLAFALNSFQDERDERREDRRATLQRSIALDERQEETLRTYIQDMSELLLQRALGASDPPQRTRSVARTLTLTALRRLDGTRKGVVVQFLSESHLIASFRRDNPDALAEPVVDLDGADLRDLVMNDAVLVDGASFGIADMRRAQFRNAFISRPDFYGTDLREADFTNATVYGSSLTGSFTSGEPGVCLSGARFLGASLNDVTIAGAGDDVDFSGARLTNVAFEGHFTNLSFRNASLQRTKAPRGSGSTDERLPRRQTDKECDVLRGEARTAARGL